MAKRIRDYQETYTSWEGRKSRDLLHCGQLGSLLELAHLIQQLCLSPTVKLTSSIVVDCIEACPRE